MINDFISKLSFSEKVIFYSGKFFNKIATRILKHNDFKFWQLHYNKLIHKGVTVDFDGEELQYGIDEMKIFSRRLSSDSMVFEQVFINDEYRAPLDVFLLNSIQLTSFMDLGSNIGLASLYVKKLFPDAKIVSVEPDADNFRMLEKNIKSNNLIDITTLLGGVGKRDCYLVKGAPKRDNKEWSYTFNEVDYPTDIRTYSIVSLMKEYFTNGVDFLKMDIEGAEERIFDSSADISFLDNVKVFAIEIHDEYQIREKIYKVLKEKDFLLLNTQETTVAIKRSLIAASN